MSEQTEAAARIRCSSAAIALSKMPPDAPPETVKALIGEMRDALDEYRTAILGSQAALVAQLPCYRVEIRELEAEDDAEPLDRSTCLDDKRRWPMPPEHGEWYLCPACKLRDALAAADAQKPALTPQEER